MCRALQSIVALSIHSHFSIGSSLQLWKVTIEKWWQHRLSDLKFFTADCLILFYCVCKKIWMFSFKRIYQLDTETISLNVLFLVILQLLLLEVVLAFISAIIIGMRYEKKWFNEIPKWHRKKWVILQNSNRSKRKDQGLVSNRFCCYETFQCFWWIVLLFERAAVVPV